MLVAFEEMGVKLNRFDPAEDMHNIRFLLRDSQPASEAKKDVIQFHKRIAKKRSRGLKNPVDAYPGRVPSWLIAVVCCCSGFLPLFLALGVLFREAIHALRNTPPYAALVEAGL